MNDRYVYAYCIPNTASIDTPFGMIPGTPIYIGMGSGNRWLAHLSESRKEKVSKNANLLKVRTMKKLLSLGQVPLIVKIVEGVSKQEALDIEIQLIAHFGTKRKIDGVEKRGPLTNAHRGGGGGRCGPLPFGAREKISKARKGVPISKDHAEKLHAGGKNRIRSAEENAKRGAAISKATTQEVVSKRNKSRAANGWYSAEALERRKQLVQDGALKHTEENRLKIAERTREAMQDESVKKKMRESSAKRWADPDAAAALREKNSRTFELTHKKSGEKFIIKNMRAYCRENGTSDYEVRRDHHIIKMNPLS